MNPATLIRPLVERFDPHQVILFGSHARGDHHEDSDLDLIVVVDSLAEERRIREEVHDAASLNRTSVDLLVTTPELLREKAGIPGTVYRNAVRDGRVLHGEKMPPLVEMGRRSRMNEKAALKHAEKLLETADGNLRIAKFGLSKPAKIPPNLILNNIQQGVEKAVKADLILRAVDYKPTHDLNKLTAGSSRSMRKAVKKVASWTNLDVWAVDARYKDIGEADVLWQSAEGAIGPAMAVLNMVQRRVREERARLKRKNRGR